MLKLGETTTVGEYGAKFVYQPKSPVPYQKPDVYNGFTFIKVVGKI